MSRRIVGAAAVLLTLLPAAGPAKEKPDPVNRIVLVGDRAGWLETGVRARPQDLVTIRAGSQVCFSGGSEASCVRADGWPRATYAESWPADATACDDPFPEWNHGAVVAMIGDQPVLVGKRVSVDGNEGAVRVAINDCSFDGELANEGQFSVVVVVENPTAHAARSGRELVDSALDAMGGKAIRRVKSLATRARCTGPGGSFTTEVKSIFPDRTLFKQSSETGSVEWLAAGDKAWRIDRELGKRKPDKKALRFVRGHEFHAMLFELDDRFSDHTVPAQAEEEPESTAADPQPDAESDCLRIEMRDPYGAPAAVCLDPETYLPVRLSYQPAGKKKEPTIEVELESWTEIEGVRYLETFTLRQGDDVFTYEYDEILPNSVELATFREVSARTLEAIRKRAKEEAKGEATGEEPAGSGPQERSYGGVLDESH